MARSISLPPEEKEVDKIVSRARDYCIRKLKTEHTSDGITRFEDSVLEKISKMKAKDKKEIIQAVLKTRRLESNPALLLGQDFASLSALAKTQVLAELDERLKNPRDQVEFLIESFVTKEKQQLERDYIFALDTCGDRKIAQRFASCMFELRILSSYPTINTRLFSTLVLDGMMGRTLNLMHIKSLRYTYPDQERLRILENIDEAKSRGINGEIRIYPSERIIFKRLDRISALFNFYGVKSRLVVIAADRDLDYLFPTDGSLINHEQLQEAKRAARTYIDCLSESYPYTDLYLLNDYLSKRAIGARYEELYQKAISDGKRGGGKLVSEKVLEMRVNHQYEHYREMFGSKYSRAHARNTAIHQIADMIALSVLFNDFDPKPIVVIDGRGFENELIGGSDSSSRTIFLTKLKDPVRVEVIE